MAKACPSITRRHFGLCLCGASLGRSAGRAQTRPMPWDEPAQVAKVYLAGRQIHWPKPDLDLSQEIREIDARLAEVERKHSAAIRFTGGQLLRSGEDVQRWSKTLAGADALLLLPLTAPTGPLAEVLQASPLPALYFSRPYAGHGWSSIAGLRRKGRRIDALASSSYGDLDGYVPVFRTVRHLRNSKVLVVTDRPASREALAAGFSRCFGTETKFFTHADMQGVFASGDLKRAEQLTTELIANSLKVVEPRREQIRDALRFYDGIRELLERERANAITLDCFGALLEGKLPAYPCIAWSRLNDQGRYGVCEGDLLSTFTQMLVTPATGVPGFVSDPVIDLSRNEVIHAHCVSATKLKGIGGPSSPYFIRNHLETADGATLQVLMPSGEVVTCAKFAAPDRFLVSTAEVTGHITTDRGCRSQIRTRVADARKMLDHYSAGLHRVIFYGNHVPLIERMGRMMGFDVVREI